MAWHRTSLATGGVSLLLLHAAAGPVAALPGLLGLLLTVALLAQAELHYRRTVRRVADGRAPSEPRLLLGAAATAVALAVAAIGLVAAGAFPLT